MGFQGRQRMYQGPSQNWNESMDPYSQQDDQMTSWGGGYGGTSTDMDNEQGSYSRRGRRESGQGSLFNRGQEYSTSMRPGEDGTSQSSTEQSYRGRGPKGYQRSDERIREDVCDALEYDDRLDASSIEVEVEKGVVTLKGQVSSRQMKREAEDCAEEIRGVKDVINSIQVKREDSSPSDEARRTSLSESDSDEGSRLGSKSRKTM